MNTLRPSYSVDSDGRFTEFAVEQVAPASHPLLRSHRIAIGLYDRTSGGEAGLSRRLRVETDVTGPRTVIGELAGQPRPDLVLVNDDDLTYAKIRLDDHSLRTLIESSTGSFTESLPAALCWAAAWDMCRDGEMAARDYVRLVLSGVSSVADISVVQTLLRQAGQAARRFADPEWQKTGLALMASVLRDLLQTAPAGSDAQLAYVRAFAGVATSADDLALLARPAGRLGPARRAQRRHRPALGAAGAAGEPRRRRDGRDRRGAGARRDRRRRAARRDLPRGDPHGRGQARGLADAHQRRADHRDVPGGAGRLRRPGSAAAHRAVPGGLLRRRGRHMARVVVGDGAGLRGRRLPGVPAVAGDGGGHRRLHRAPRIRPPRCAACSPRGATTCSGRCAARPATGRPGKARPAGKARPGCRGCR